MENIEQQDAFYLGKTKEGTPLLYDSKNFTTHAVILGMTGSGKTGLGISLIEEAGLDKIPAILIDPKGDLTNLLLTFPHLSPEEFSPWLDAGVDKGEAESLAKAWQKGLASSGESVERIQRLKNSVEMTIYTPGSRAGVPLSILSSLTAPSKELMLDSELFRDRIASITSSLLGLLKINADPLKSREHILISSLFTYNWEQGKDLDLSSLIRQVQKPPFSQIGAMDVDSFFPPKERMTLSMSLNHLLAAPGFQVWMEGEPMEIQNLLYTKAGKPKFAILSIAHLSESERMFFVTLFLNEFLSWMRRQSGSSDLKALLYMDEIFGFFPPLAMPPSKMPMLRLLKTARAFGIGIVLSTQNPVDLDYKGLSNCGTWFIGKLQTEQDRRRVVDGLQAASNGELDSKSLNEMLSTLANRTFIMRSIYEKNPILFQTRWTLSYLRGPLTLPQIQSLTGPQAFKEKTEEVSQILPPGIQEYYLNNGKGSYSPFVLGIANLHFVDAKNKIDQWKEVSMMAPYDEETKEVLWKEGEEVSNLQKTPTHGGELEKLPSGLLQAKNYENFGAAFASYLYQNYTQDLKDSAKVSVLKEKIRRTEEKISQKKQSFGYKTLDTLISFGKTILEAVLGKKMTKGTITNASTSIGKIGRAAKENGAISSLEQDLETYKADLADLEEKTLKIHPRKSDLKVEKVALVWKN